MGTYTDVIETLRIMQENQNLQEERMEEELGEELEEIVQDLSRENEKNEKNKKRNRTHELSTQEDNKHIRQNTSNYDTPDQSGDEESDSDSSRKAVLNSTPIPSQEELALNKKVLSNSLTEEARRTGEITQYYTVTKKTKQTCSQSPSTRKRSQTHYNS